MAEKPNYIFYHFPPCLDATHKIKFWTEYCDRLNYYIHFMQDILIPDIIESPSMPPAFLLFILTYASTMIKERHVHLAEGIDSYLQVLRRSVSEELDKD